jgi:uncharacterized phage protein (TIGR01671 family)
VSRQIKFRVWDEKNGRFIRSDEHSEFYEFFETGPCSCGHEDIAEQFTGLLDSEGKEIYEGDILAFLEGDFQRGQDGFDDRLEVVWDGKNSKFGANFYSKYGGEGCTGKERCLSEYNKEIIVIGNIHQNPELLTT